MADVTATAEPAVIGVATPPAAGTAQTPGGGSPYPTVDPLDVQAWATLDDVTRVTGVAVSQQILMLAQYIVETSTNRTYAGQVGMRTRDLSWLRMGVCWQAAWLPSQPGLLTQLGVKGISQDGVSVQYGAESDQWLAPLAKRALKNCSWMGIRSLRFGTRNPRLPDRALAGYTAAAFLNSGADPDYMGWEPVGDGGR